MGSLRSGSHRFVQENAETANRWKETITKSDKARMEFPKRYGFMISMYSQMLDELSGVGNERFVTTPLINKYRVPATAWNRLPPIPGPAPAWYNTKTHLASSKEIGYGVSRKSEFTKLDFKISHAGHFPRKRGDIYQTLKWPQGAVN